MAPSGTLTMLKSVVGDGEGGQHEAFVARCTCAPEDTPSKFLVFQLKTHTHFHLQCESCGTSYCPAGGCQ